MSLIGKYGIERGGLPNARKGGISTRGAVNNKGVVEAHFLKDGDSAPQSRAPPTLLPCSKAYQSGTAGHSTSFDFGVSGGTFGPERHPFPESNAHDVLSIQ